MQKVKSAEIERILNTMITRQVQMVRDDMDYQELKRELNMQCNKEAITGLGWALNEDCSVKEMWEYLPSEQVETENKSMNNTTFIQKKAMRGSV